MKDRWLIGLGLVALAVWVWWRRQAPGEATSAAWQPVVNTTGPTIIDQPPDLAGLLPGLASLAPGTRIATPDLVIDIPTLAHPAAAAKTATKEIVGTVLGRLLRPPSPP